MTNHLEQNVIHFVTGVDRLIGKFNQAVQQYGQTE